MIDPFTTEAWFAMMAGLCVISWLVGELCGAARIRRVLERRQSTLALLQPILDENPTGSEFEKLRERQSDFEPYAGRMIDWVEGVDRVSGAALLLDEQVRQAQERQQRRADRLEDASFGACPDGSTNRTNGESAALSHGQSNPALMAAFGGSLNPAWHASDGGTQDEPAEPVDNEMEGVAKASLWINDPLRPGDLQTRFSSGRRPRAVRSSSVQETLAALQSETGRTRH